MRSKIRIQIPAADEMNIKNQSVPPKSAKVPNIPTEADSLHSALLSPRQNALLRMQQHQGNAAVMRMVLQRDSGDNQNASGSGDSTDNGSNPAGNTLDGNNTRDDNGPLPNLVPVGQTITPNPVFPKVGESVAMQWTDKNIGAGAAGAYTDRLQIFKQVDQQPEAFDSTEDASIDGLAPNASTLVTAQHTFSQPGTYDFGVTVNAGDSPIPETTQDDNVITMIPNSNSLIVAEAAG